MKLSLSFVFALSALDAVEAAVIDYDKVQPFREPEPKTVSEKAAVKYKPSLFISNGCHPYAAVNAAGDTNGGLTPKPYNFEGMDENPHGDCQRSALGSQVYSRSGWYRDVWAIMYAWYFPKDTSWVDNPTVRHDWINAIVWLNNPALENPSLLGVSVNRGTWVDQGRKYVAYPPRLRDAYMNGTHLRVEYFTGMYAGGYHSIDISGETGDFQDLISWTQLTDKARNALETADFGMDAPAPFNDANFEKNLERGWIQNKTIIVKQLDE